MAEYICPLSKTGTCKYGGNKTYNYGFISGIASYCYHIKKFIDGIDKCPLKKTK